jgi:hypothetical protein
MSNSISTLLKQKRRSSGQSLEEISDRLKIRIKYLQAIEDDSDASDIPAPVYMLGYLKTYADYLGLDGQSMISQLKSQYVEISELCLPEVIINDNKPNANINFIASFTLFFIAIIWYGAIFKKDPLSEPARVISEVIKVNNNNSYLLAKGTSKFNDSIPTLKNINFNDYQEALIKNSNEIILVAKSNSNIKITDRFGKIIVNEELLNGNVYLVPYNEGMAITIKDKNAVAIFNKGKLFDNKIHSL